MVMREELNRSRFVHSGMNKITLSLIRCNLNHVANPAFIGRRLNGVLNVGHTLDAALPVCTPIDTHMFENAQGSEARDALASQILDVLYTIRNNTFHGGKRADDVNDREVLEKALPLLAMYEVLTRNRTKKLDTAQQSEVVGLRFCAFPR